GPGDVWEARPLAHVLGSHVDSGGSERALVTPCSVAAPVEAELGRRVADEGDTPVAEFNKVSRCDLTAGDVVDRDAREARMHRVDQDAGYVRSPEALDLGLGRERGDDEQAVCAVAAVEELE